MKETLVNLLVFVGILLAAAVVTNWFARTMYQRCAACGTLNARRRTNCRACQKQLKGE